MDIDRSQTSYLSTFNTEPVGALGDVSKLSKTDISQGREDIIVNTPPSRCWTAPSPSTLLYIAKPLLRGLAIPYSYIFLLE